MKHFTKTATAAALAAAALMTAVPAAAQGRITIGTNPTGTIYAVVGGGLAKLFSEKLGQPATAQPYAGSSVYLPLISNGEVTTGLSSSLDSGRAYSGAMTGERIADLRTLARLWPLRYGYMVRADSGIETIEDLRGKRVVVEIKANDSLSEANRAMLASGGLTEKDVKPVTIGGLPQGVQGVQDGSIDATAIAVGIPLTREAHAAVPGGISYVSLTGPKANDAFLAEQFPGLYLMPLKPSPNAPGAKEGTNVVGFDVMLVADAQMSDEQAAAIVKTLHENWQALQTDYPVLKSGDKAKLAAASNTAPYHPGAKAYFQSVGLWNDANESREAALAK